MKLLPLEFTSENEDAIKYGWNLSIFLYRGATQISKYQRHATIIDGSLGRPRKQRLELLRAIHALLADELQAGGSIETLESKVRALLAFYTYCDRTELDPTTDFNSLKSMFVRWIEYEKSRRSEQNGRALYHITTCVARILGDAIGVKGREFLKAVNVPEIRKEKTALSSMDDQRLFVETFAFSQFLIDVIDSLSYEAISGELPIKISLRSGVCVDHWCKCLPPDLLKDAPSLDLLRGRKMTRSATMYVEKQSSRSPVINLRIEAEMLLFIAQTGMNFSQARRYEVGDFRFSSFLGGYNVRRRYKDRRFGEVEFEIFSEYRRRFESYLRWRDKVLLDPKDRRLFPFTYYQKKNSYYIKNSFQRTRKLAKQLSIRFFGPRSLRGVRINWLLRKSEDPALVADMAQHSVQTLLRTYRIPDHRKALRDINNYWKEADPLLSPPGPGACIKAEPIPLTDMSSQAPKPDCEAASGCLFCVHHRDLKTFDYVWSLLSFRYLKSVELARQKVEPPGGVPHPAHLLIERITEKTQAMIRLDSQFAGWVSEASTRVREGEFHPYWTELIEVAEAM